MLNLNEQTIDAYKQKVRAQIKEMKAQMQMFEAGADKTSADMRIKYQKNMDEWKSRFNDIEKKLDEFSDSAEGSWDDIRSGIEKSVNDLKNSMDSTIKHFIN